MIRQDAKKRAEKARLQREIKALESADDKVAKKARAKAKRQREKALARTAGQRNPRVKDGAYLSFIRRQPCCVCHKPAPSQAAHIRSGYPEANWPATGMAEKPSDYRTLPLCPMCHVDGPAAQHKGNERAWWASHEIYPPSLCASYRARFDGDEL